MGVIKRVVRGFAEGFTSHVAALVCLWIAVTGFGFAAAIDTSWQAAFVGVSAGLLAVVIIKITVATWEYRHENETMVKRVTTLRVDNAGRSLRYEVVNKVRARKGNFKETAIRLSWSGETLLTATDVRPIGGGFTHTVIPTSSDGKSVNIVFTLDQPLKRWRSVTVGVEMDLDEPARNYKQILATDASSFAWALFARLVFVVVCDGSASVDLDTVEGYALRSAWDRHMESTAPMNHVRADRMARVEHGRQWTIVPVRPDRYYQLRYKLREFVQD